MTIGVVCYCGVVMHETFKNVSVFVVFVCCMIAGVALREQLKGYFDFEYGKTVLLCLYGIAGIVVFHLLYHFLGKSQEKTIYISTLLTIVTMGGLIYFDRLPLY